VLGHSADALLEPLAQDDPDAGALRDGAKELDQHYVPARYPNSLPGTIPFQAYTAEQARRSLAHAQRIVELARRKTR